MIMLGCKRCYRYLLAGVAVREGGMDLAERGEAIGASSRKIQGLALRSKFAGV